MPPANFTTRTRRPVAVTLAVSLLLSLFTAAIPPRQAKAFSGEDPLNGKPWHHEDITEKAAKAVGFTDGSADALGWHADYIDSYLYNPLWWAKGGMHRLKSSLATGKELEKLHFDDLFARDRVDHTWRRYLSGTIAGLIWARENDDVSAAQNVVGVSLHAVQDFYSHSNWVDVVNRRNRTYHQTPLAERNSLFLYTGAYEKGEHQGIKHHGKIAPAATIFNQPGIKQLMDIAASPFSPLQNTSLVQHYKEVKNGTPIQPYLPFSKEDETERGLKVPDNVIFLAPTGIALDNTWVSEVGVRERGLTDMTGRQAFDTAKNLAIQSSTEWLKRIETVMNKTEENRAFWKKVKETSVDQNTREREYENFSKFPYTFLSAGPYAVNLPSTGEEFFLRIKLKTSSSAFSGTNADIRLKVGNQTTLLDYLPRGLPLVADDFEAGDTRVYVAGPYSAMPTSITLHNDSPNFVAILKSLGHTFSKITESIGSTALSLIGGHADHVVTKKKIWLGEELATIPPAGKPFEIDLNGGNEGHYRVTGLISRVGQGGEGPEAWAQYSVLLARLDCIKESKNDRGSNSDEPFLLTLLSSLPGDTSRYRTNPFKDVDKGESNVINYKFTSGKIPYKQGGAITLPISVMESDDETETMRRKLLDAFAGKVEDETAPDKRGFLTALDSARAADWKLEHMEVYAWSRNGAIKTGKVYNNRVDRWIDGGKMESFTLNTAELKPTGITTDELLAPAPHNGGPVNGGTDPAPVPTPTPPTEPTLPPPPGVPTNPTPPVGNPLSLLTGLKGRWMTNAGSLLNIEEAITTAGTPATLHASAKKGGFSLEDFYLRVEDGVVKGLWKSTPSANLATDWGAFGIVTINSLAPDGNSFLGKVVLKSGNEFAYSGTRIKDGANTNNPGTPGNTGVVPPPSSGGTARIGDGRFYPLDKWDVRFDEMKPGRTGNTIELIATFKNTDSRDGGITAGTFDPTLLDPDGVVMKDHGNLYRGSGERPERLASTVIVAPGGQAKVRYVFDIPSNVHRLKTLRVVEYQSRPVLVDISTVPVPGAEDGAAPAAPELPGGIVPVPDARFLGVDDLDVRVDGVRRGRGGNTLEAFLTVKNPTSKTQTLSAGLLDLTVTDEDGVGTRRIGNLYLATGDQPEYLNRNILISAGGQARVRYVFELASPSVKLTKMTIKGYKPPARIINLPELPETR